MTAVARKPNCLKCGGDTYYELTREICAVCGYAQGEGAYLAPELLPVRRMSLDDVVDGDVLDCGTPSETWREFVAHLRKRAAHARAIATDYEKDAKDAAAQAKIHRISAEEFTDFADAMERVPITSRAVSQTLAEMVRPDGPLAGIETGTAETENTGSVPKG